MRLDGEDLSSSPDPLATSFNDENTFSRSSPVKGAYPSPTKHRVTKVLQDITLSSPPKARRRSAQSSRTQTHSQAEPFLSPWKIRVTVEAEPEEAGYGRVRSTSRTTMVPLRDTPSPTKNSKGGSRSNSGSRRPGSTKRTASTSVGNGRQNRGSDMSRLTDLDTGFLDDDEEVQVKPKRKPRPRKSRKAADVDDIFADEDTRSCTAERGLDAEPLHSLSNTREGTPAFKAGSESERVAFQAGESPKLRELDLNRVSVRSRGGPVKSAKSPTVEQNSRDHGTMPIATLSAARSSAAGDDSKRRVSAASAITYPTPDASVQDEIEALGPPSDPTEDHLGFDTILESEGFTMIDLESLPSARHFVTSPDTLEHRQTEAMENSERAADLERLRSVSYPVLAPSLPCEVVHCSPTSLLRDNKPPPTPIPSYLASPEEGESDLSSTVPSSPPVEIVQPTLLMRSQPVARSPLRQAHTPLPSAKSSPKLPSPPNQPSKAEVLLTYADVKATPPRLARVVRAGIALQGLLSSKARTPSLGPSPIPKVTKMGNGAASTPKERLDDLFGGFDSGTRRELRAGLRFGEELAKRQRLSLPQPESSGQGEIPTLNEQDRLQDDTVWRGENFIKHTPVSSNDLQAMSASSCEDGNTPAPQDTPRAQNGATLFDANKTVGSYKFLDFEARERRWQSEREAISQQIENANTSQVIVIDSDDEGETNVAGDRASATQPSPTKSVASEAEEDIWLAEAEVAQNSSRHTEENLFPRAEQFKQRKRAEEVISKPRRNLIPSPWKRGENVDSTFMTDGDISGMLWQRPKSKEGTGSMDCLPSIVKSVEARTRSSDVNEMISESRVQEEETFATTEGVHYQDLEDISKHGARERCPSQNEADVSEHENDLTDKEVLAPEADPGIPSGNSEERFEESSILARPKMIPVNFNDITDLNNHAKDQVQTNTPPGSSPSSPWRPVTPRSAMKGARASLSFVNKSASPTPRKVVFSRRSLCLDDSGLETSMRTRGDSLSPTPSIDPDDPEVVAWYLEYLRNEDEEKKRQSTGAASVPAPAQRASISWFSRLTGWGSKAAPAPAPALTEAPQQPPQCPSNPGNSDSSIPWEPTKASIPSTGVTSSSTASASPFAAMHASDPRHPPPPETMAVSGYFTDYHYKHLNILWLKSQTPRFTHPGSIRPLLSQYIGQKLYTKDKKFDWVLTKLDAEVVERWIRSFEGREVKEVVKDWRDMEGKYRKLGWSEWELCRRLLGIVVGQELRRGVKGKKELKSCEVVL